VFVYLGPAGSVQLGFDKMYTSFMKTAWEFPAKYGWFVAAWAYLHLQTNATSPGMKEIGLAEWTATPGKYLTHPDMHPEKFAKIPGAATIPNHQEELLKRTGHGAAHGHGH
jgi:hypothetical protein